MINCSTLPVTRCAWILQTLLPSRTMSNSCSRPTGAYKSGSPSRQIFGIALDQSRYIALIFNRFLPSKGVEDVTNSEIKRYVALLPYDFVATKEDRSASYMEVLQLEEKLGIGYTSAIEMLIYLMCTAFILHFSITKLRKSDTLPDKTYFKAMTHLLNHLRCNHTTFGITDYSKPILSPVAQPIKNSCRE